LQLNWCTIQSPINGKIGLRLVDPGNIITANTTNLVIINQFQPIAVYFTLPEDELPQVLHKLAAEKRLAVDAYDQDDTQKLATGYLLTADNQIDTTTGTGKLKAVFDNKDAGALPQPVRQHSSGDGRAAQRAGGALGGHPDRQPGFVCVGGRSCRRAGKRNARIQLVKVALAEGQVTILDSGLQPGQNVVVDGADRLRPDRV
jgi:multidrug efflux system membrane fusion protein